MMRSLYSGVIAVAVALTGCATVTKGSDQEQFEQLTGVDRHSSFPAVRRNAFEYVNFLELVDPGGEASERFETAWKKTLGEGGDIKRDAEGGSHRSYGAQYDLVLAWFRQANIEDAEKKRRRNAIQERILSVSLSRCNVFKTYLRRDQVDTNFLLGALTTVSGILGAVLQGVNSSRNLAGAAGLFSGVRAEYNQSYYSNLAAHVIVKGIEARQEEVYRRIQTEGQTKSIEIYPLEAAIKDAIYFDGLCSVVVGLDKAAASVDMASEPGLDAAMRTVLRAGLLREAVDAKNLSAPEVLDKFGAAGSRLGLSLVGSARTDTGTGASEVALYVEAGNLIERIQTAVKDTAGRVDQAAMARKTKVLAELPPDGALAKSLSAAPPKTGDVAAKIKAALDAALSTTLRLDVDTCFARYGLPALQARGDAVKAKQAVTAKNDDERQKADTDAEYQLKKADRAVQQARDDLKHLEALVKFDLAAYENGRKKAIEEVDLEKVKAAANWDSLMTPGSVTLGSSKGCGKD